MTRLWTVLLVAAGTQAADLPTPGGEKPPIAAEGAAKSRTQVYTLFELLEKADRIVLADIGPTTDGLTKLTVRETLKAPASDKQWITDDKRKRAQALLDGALVPEAAPVASGPSQVLLKAENRPLPREGAQALFVLWEKTAAPSANDAAYTVGHPQNLYDAELAPQIRAALSRPRLINDGRYLRPFDAELAARLRQRDADSRLFEMAGGEETDGLKLEGLRPALSVRKDNSFSVTAKVVNTRPRELMIFDGPLSGFGVMLSPKEGQGDPILLRAGSRQWVDTSVLDIPDITDFARVPGSDYLSKELFFDVKEFPVLARLKGKYGVKVFYRSEKDGRGLDLDTPVWLGALLSKESELTFDTLNK